MSEQSSPDLRPTPIPGVAIAALFGAAVGAIVSGGWALLYGLGLTPYPPFDLGDLLIRAAPGEFATWTIEALGEYAQPLALAAGVVLWLLTWIALGVAIRTVAERGWSRLVPLVMLPPALLLADWSEAGLDAVRLIGLAITFGATLFGGGWLLSHWLSRLTESLREQASAPSGSWLEQTGDYSRRQLLRQIAGGVLVLGGGGAWSGRLLRSTSLAEGTTLAGLPLADVRLALASPVALPTPDPTEPLPIGFDAPSGVRPRVTSNDEFYVVDISTRDPTINEQTWSLQVRGRVERELLITWPELLQMPATELDGTLMCISYEHGNGLISSTRWTGVPLRDVLANAGVRASAVDVVLRGSNGYSDSIPLAKALEASTLLAYGMNGTTLPRSHGFPCRVYVPGLYGEKHVKWLHEIEVVDYDYFGFWQERGWTDIAVNNTVAIIDTPRDTAIARDGIVTVGGIAFAGVRGISAVELRVDDGTWQLASLEPNEPAFIWQRWRFDWNLPPGSHRLTVRAVDGHGNVQTAEERPPHPDGMTGLHSVQVEVV